MILPIVAYGDPVLRSKGENISQDYPELEKLIADMFETMYEASGVGLAASQIGKPLRLFLVDATPFDDEYNEAKDFKKVFINAKITHREGEEEAYNEGCLSFPKLREDVYRHPRITIEYEDQYFEHHIEHYDGILSRIIQHEYDHIEGILMVDHLSSLRRTLLKRRLLEISKGDVRIDYKMKFPIKK
ncbi:MAG: peptide deformylase [Bacteroidota bacterium]